jgi:membrane dipeptidase
MDHLKKVLKISENDIERGLELHKKFIICDSLCQDPIIFTDKMLQKIEKQKAEHVPLDEIRKNLGLSFGDVGLMQKELLEDTDARREYENAWRRSGITCIGRTIPAFDLEQAYRTLAKENAKVNIFPNFLTIAHRAKDIRLAKKEDKHALLLQFQRTIWLGGFHNIEEELNKINTFYSLGARTMQLTYNLQNLVGTGCASRQDSGLSHFGVKVVERMNKVGMLVDVSHCGYKTTLDATEISKTPVAATHTICRDLYNHPRGKKDEQIQEMAEKGGYIGITGIKEFTAPPPKLGTLHDWLDHIDHAINLVGVKHVGIASDLWYGWTKMINIFAGYQSKQAEIQNWWSGFKPEHHPKFEEIKRSGAIMKYDEDDLMAWVNWPNITIGLVSRGYSDSEIEYIVGKSFLNIIQKVIG